MLSDGDVVSGLRVNELYPRLTVQGEGPHTGRLCTFVRLYGCNLHCSWCDTPYTWDTDGRNGVAYPAESESKRMSVDRIVAAVDVLDAPLVIVTGGEPLLQASKVIELADALAELDIETHVETNGTKPPPLADQNIAHYSVSPKLKSADAGASIDEAILRQWAEHPRAVFKVCVGDLGDLDEAMLLFNRLRLTPSQRWVMVETRPGEPQTQARERAQLIADAAIQQHHLNISPRLHVDLWGAEARGV